jgi:hypothetical protein
VPGYLQRIRRICERNDVLLIADEVMCGSGRTGQYFAHTHDAVLPDIVTLAKGIAGGYMPLAAVVVRQHLFDRLRESGFPYGHTYIGHATACSAGVAVAKAIDDAGLLERTQIMGERFLARLREAFRDHPFIGDIRGRGLFIGLELMQDRTSRAGFADRSNLAAELRLAALEQGLICYPGSIEVDGLTVPHVMLAPPMIVEDPHFDECIEKLSAALGGTLVSAST